MNRGWRIGLAILLVAGVCAAPATAGWGPAATADTSYPNRPNGPIYDGANIIPEATERQVDARLRKHNAQSGTVLVVATVPGLGGEGIESHAAALLDRDWTIDGVDADPDVLVLVAPNERTMRIEVRLGLREAVPDDIAGAIIRDEFTPRFRNGDFGGGIDAGVAALIAQLGRGPAGASAAAEAASESELSPMPERRRPAGADHTWRDWANIIAWFLWFAFMAWLLAKVRRYLLGPS